jgi:hypothetical protein
MAPGEPPAPAEARAALPHARFEDGGPLGRGCYTTRSSGSRGGWHAALNLRLRTAGRRRPVLLADRHRRA